MSIKRSFGASRRLAIVAAAFTAIPVLAFVGVAHAATNYLTAASVTLNDPRPYTASPLVGNSVSYDFLASSFTAGTTIKCIKEVYSVNPDGSGGVPSGMVFTSSSVNTIGSTVLGSHSGWTLDNSTTAGTLAYTNSTGATPAGASAQHFVVDGIRNGTIANDDYYVTFSTHTDTGCTSGAIVDTTTVGYIFVNGQQVSLTVDGSLSFSVNGIAGTGSNTVNGANITNGVTTTATTIPFGTLTSTSNRVAAQDLTVSTNSGGGYTVSTRYTGKPTYGSFTIDDLPTYTNTNPGSFTGSGTEAFGYTTEDTSLGTGTANRFSSNKWAAFTTSNAEVAYNGAPVSNQTTRVGFQAGISGTTEPGNYQTTVIYTATPVY